MRGASEGAESDWIRFWLALALGRSGRYEVLDPALERLTTEHVEESLGRRDGVELDPALARIAPPLPETVAQRSIAAPGESPGTRHGFSSPSERPVVAGEPRGRCEHGRPLTASPTERARVRRRSTAPDPVSSP